MALNKQQQAFIEHYLVCLNATKAARKAGYSDRYLNTNASKLLQNTTIRAEIDRRLREVILPANEVLARYTDMATSNISEFATIATARDLENLDNGYLVKKFKRDVVTDQLGRQHEKIEIELYDAKSALDSLAKYHHLLTDKLEITWRDKLPPDKDPDEVKRQFVEMMKLAAKQQNASND